MLKSTFCALNWRRLIVVGALLVLVATIWTSQIGVRNRASDGPNANSTAIAAFPAGNPQSEPQDAAGWRALGENRFEGGEYADAVTAYQHAVALAPGNAVTWAALGEARVMASAHDPMPSEAWKDFHEASTLDPKEPRARYFLAVAKDLTGDHGGAINDWLGLLGDTPKGAPWEADLRRTIAQVGAIHHIAVATRIAAVRQPVPLVAPALAGAMLPNPAEPDSTGPGIAGPTAQDLQAASAIPPSQQQAMAEAMVARLEQRLATNPHNAAGWAMLIRSRMTLDGAEKAAAVLARAVTADPANAPQLREQAQALGVK